MTVEQAQEFFAALLAVLARLAATAEATTRAVAEAPRQISMELSTVLVSLGVLAVAVVVVVRGGRVVVGRLERWQAERRDVEAVGS